jgi:hypothetical protein
VGDVLLAYELPVEGGADVSDDIQAEPPQDHVRGLRLADEDRNAGLEFGRFYRDREAPPEGVSVGSEEEIDEIDRSAKDPAPASEPLKARDVSAMLDDQQPATAQADDSGPRNSRSEGTEAEPSPVERFKRQAPNFPGFDRSDAGDEWELEAPQAPTGGALHASLDSIARRRLQMIDAMASFSAEKSSMLALQPQRTVDGRTLEMLTAVQGVRNFVQ